ncbi:MAG: zf-HC2 domain-containing protein [Actinomycetota bacterium]|nr:zf-HC2 domain-containing protein [Actinomycetota bacterium]
MTDLRGRSFSGLVAGLNAGQHLTVDAVVAFVDGELGAAARDRAAQHLSVCQSCTTEVGVQHLARRLMRSAQCPQVPAELLAVLRDIPRTAELPGTPDGLAVADDGTVVEVADPAPTAPLGSGAPLGANQRWGTGPSVLGRWMGR